MSEKTLGPPLIVEHDGPIARVTLNRPDALNTLNQALVEALLEATATLAADDAVRVVILRGAGKHFMAGGDLHEFATMLEHSGDQRYEQFHRMIGRLHGSIEQLARMPHPVIAGVHGAVAGFGLSLMCACDLAFAADNAYFASAYRNIALTPDGGGTWSLPRLVGLHKAMEILLFAERFDARQALELGLVNRVVPPQDLERSVEQAARALASAPVEAIRGAKRLLRMSAGNSLSQQLDLEAASFARCAASPDFAEGIRAFLEKRPPQFQR